MEKKIKITLSKNINKNIFNFLNLSNGTKRSICSFKRNKIIFVIAKKQNNIIGCIPIEPRNLRIGKKIIKTFFITNAYVKKNFQNKSIGTELLKYYNQKIKKPLFAFRLFNNDQASKWYKKNNFKKVYDIYSYKLNLKKLKKFFKYINPGSTKFEYLILNDKNKKKISRILLNKKGHFLNYSNLYYNNYYMKYFREMFIFFKLNNNYMNYCTIGLTNMGNSPLRYEIFDNNLNYKNLLYFLHFFINSKIYKKKYPINLKINNNNKDFKKIDKFFNKEDYKSNLITNFKLNKKNKFLFNSIEYV
jgi:N-acetylglutamate synthase-like GNAT family acetyltransferase